MHTKTIISADLKSGTEITFCDYSKSARKGEAIVEVHYYYDVLNKYDIFHYPEHFENAKNAMKEGDTCTCKVIYHMPSVEETN